MAFLSGSIYSDVQHAMRGSDIPDDEYNVTCYAWTENGSQKVWCPDRVYAPDSVVNISVEHTKPMEGSL